MRTLRITDDAILRPFEEPDAAELTQVIVDNRQHLSRWLPWAETYGFADSVEHITGKSAEIVDEGGLDGPIVLDGRIVGGASTHRIDKLNRGTSIGYWLAAEAEGRGLMSATVRALLDHLFGELDLHRVVIEVVVGNERSRAIPERLGFTQEGVLREAKLIRGRYEDAWLYAMLAPDWPASPPREATGSE